jgi:hypothetical protein
VAYLAESMKPDVRYLEERADTLTKDSTTELMRAHRGGKLSRNQATLLEQQVDVEPNDVKSRVSLLGYYHRSSGLSWSGVLWSAFRGNSIHQRRYVDLITWFVEHRSQSIEAGLPEMYPPLGFDESVSKILKELWEKQIAKSPTNVAVLCNAASFFYHTDKVVSEELLRSAQELDPDNAYLAGRLSQLRGRICGERIFGKSVQICWLSLPLLIWSRYGFSARFIGDW